MARPTVFLDRDGVLIRDVHLLTQVDQVELKPEATEALALLKFAGFALVVVSNQPVVARGLATEKQVEAVHDHIQGLLCQVGGPKIERFFFCPHHPNADIQAYRVNCHCRKPEPGMLLSAAQELGLDLNRSYLVGDRPSDILAGQRAGCHTIMVETGMHALPPIETAEHPQKPVEPDYRCTDILAAAKIILDEES